MGPDGAAGIGGAQSDGSLLGLLRARLREKELALHDLAAVARRQEELQARLRESEARKEEFLSNVRNEINNPLAAILCLSRSIAAGEVAGGGERRAAAAEIVREAAGLDFQLRNMAAAGELEAGESVAEPSPAEVKALVRGAAAAGEEVEEARGVRVELLLGEGTQGEVVTDGPKLQLLIENLVSNAVKFSPAGSAVTVEAVVRDGSLTVRVSDSGPGIGPEERRHLFERFHQGEAGRRKRFHGHGLGLAVARGLAEVLGGTLALESPPGAGTVLALRLPARPPRADGAVEDRAWDGAEEPGEERF